MKLLSKLIFLTLIFVVATTFVSAQKPKPEVKPKPEAAPKATPKADDSDDLFNFEFDEKLYQEISKAIDEFDRKKAEEFYKQGLPYWKTFDINEAIDSFTKAIELYPNFTDALRERGRIYAMIGKNKEAIPDLSAFLQTQPNSVEFLNFRGLAYSGIVEEMFEDEAAKSSIDEIGEKALADFNKAVELEPKTAVFYTNRGKLFADFNLLKEAIDDLEKAIALDNKSALAYTNLGLAKFYLNPILGLTEMNRAVEVNPKSAVSYFNRGTFYRMSGDYPKAIADYTKAIDLHGTKPEYYNARGMAFYTNSDGVAAANDFSTAVAQSPEYGRAYFNRALTYKTFPESAAEYNSKDAEFEGIALQHQKMLNDLNLAIKYNPNLADAYIERGLLRSTTTAINIDGLDAETIKVLNLALADFDKAAKLNPQSAEAFNGRGDCYDQLGKKDLALADYNKAIQLDPQLATAYMGRMGIYCETGKIELSKADEKKIKELGFAAINMCSLKK